MQKLVQVNQQRKSIQNLRQLDVMKQFASTWFFSIFPSCLPALTCIEESSTAEEPGLQENLIRGSINVMLVPPHSPFILSTDDTASRSKKEMQAFSNKTNIKNCEDDCPDLGELLHETEPEPPQVVQLTPESETPEKYMAGQPHLPKIERIPTNPFEILVSSSSVGISARSACMRWTPELHDHFVEAVNHLGGTEKATPNGILNHMKIEGLTIEHTESHLQRYLTARGRCESSQEGEFETKSSQMEETPSLGIAIDDIDINEALKIQMEVQKQLHEHLEMQRMLQMRLDEQGKNLKRMIEQQHHATVNQYHASP